MPFNIQHKCNMAQADLSEFGMFRTTDERGAPVTRIECPQCREQMIMQGHDLFNEAIQNKQARSNLPPGFVIPRTRVAG